MRTNSPNTKSSPRLLPVIAATKKLWRQYHPTHDHTHNVAKEALRAHAIERPKSRQPVIAPLARGGAPARHTHLPHAGHARSAHQAAVPDGPHGCRSSCTSGPTRCSLPEHGMPVQQIQKVPSHSKLETALMYAESRAGMIKVTYHKALGE